MPETLTNAVAWFKSQLPTLDPKDLLPLGIDIQTGAIILGNPSTPNLLVAEFRNGIGTFGIVSVWINRVLVLVSLIYHDANSRNRSTIYISKSSISNFRTL